MKYVTRIFEILSDTSPEVQESVKIAVSGEIDEWLNNFGCRVFIEGYTATDHFVVVTVSLKPIE